MESRVGALEAVVNVINQEVVNVKATAEGTVPRCAVLERQVGETFAKCGVLEAQVISVTNARDIFGGGSEIIGRNG